MPEQELVPASPEPEVSDVVSPEMLGKERITPEVVVPEVIPGQEVADADLKSELEKVQAELADLQSRSTQDMDGLRSSLDRSRSQALLEKDQELDAAEGRLHAAVTANLDETEAMRYNLTVAEQKVELHKSRYQEMQQQVDAMQNMDSWTRGFMQMGVSYPDIDRSSPELCIQSGYAALEKNRQGTLAKNEENLAKITDLENTIKQLQAAKEAGTPTGTLPATPRAPEAAPTLGAQTGSTPSQTKTVGQLLTSLEAQLGYKVTEDDMWSMINTGQLSMDILSGLIIP